MSRNLAKSAVWITLSEIIFNFSSYVIHAVVGRILEPSEYGRFSLIITLTTMVIILIGRGIPTAMTKYISEVFESRPEMVRPIKRKAAFLQIILMGGITILFFLLAPVIAWALHDRTLTPLFQLSALIIPTFALAAFYVQYFIGLHQFNIQSLLKVVRSLFRIGFVVGLAYFFGVKGAVSGYILAPLSLSLVALIIDKIWIEKKYPQSLGINYNSKKLLNYAWHIILFFLAYELMISIDLYLVKGILRDDYLTGIYNASLTVGRIPYYAFYALTLILLPVVSKSTAENNQKETNDIIKKSLRLMLMLLVPVVILMSSFAEPIIRFFYGAKYVEAAAPMAILVYGVGFLTVFYVLCFVMNGAGKTKIPMVISILGFIINAILNYILIKQYALIGSAVATSITSVLITIIILFYLNRDFKGTIKANNLVKILLSGIIIYFLSQLFSQKEYIFIVWGIILFAFYILILWLFREITKTDLEFVKKIISRKKVIDADKELSGNEPSA
jgi:stage V sporulation protein B